MTILSALTLQLYAALVWCGQPFLRRKLVRRGKAEPGYLLNIEERFGNYTQAHFTNASSNTKTNTSTNSKLTSHNPRHKPLVWIHAVSLGETRAAAVLIAELRQQLPGMRLLLTHGTATGRAEGQKLLQAGDVQVWQAWDVRDVTERFITYFQPSIGIMMETELWPNMAATCTKQKIPLVIANARMSEKTWLKTMRFAALAKPVYQSLAAVWPQTQEDASRFKTLGAPEAGVFGNLKFDAHIDVAQLAQGTSWKTKLSLPVVMFASSREGEELQLLRYLQANEAAAAQVHWLIVPRHPQRFAEVERLIQQHGFKVSKRSGSDWQVANGVNALSAAQKNAQTKTQAKLQTTAQATIWLGDSLGEMAMYYGLSDVALLGGSFEPLGGQNLIEAAACACPVVMGPSTFNFSQAAEQAIEAQAAYRCIDLAQAVDTALAWVGDDEKQENLQENSQETLQINIPLSKAKLAAQAFANSHQGAAKKTALAVKDMLFRQKRVDAS